MGIQKFSNSFVRGQSKRIGFGLEPYIPGKGICGERRGSIELRRNQGYDSGYRYLDLGKEEKLAFCQVNEFRINKNQILYRLNLRNDTMLTCSLR